MEPPRKEEWIGIVEEIYAMEKLTHRLRLRLNKHSLWENWTIFRTKTGDEEDGQ